MGSPLRLRDRHRLLPEREANKLPQATSLSEQERLGPV
jgi:hypothetical protein